MAFDLNKDLYLRTANLLGKVHNNGTRKDKSAKIINDTSITSTNYDIKTILYSPSKTDNPPNMKKEELNYGKRRNSYDRVSIDLFGKYEVNIKNYNMSNLDEYDSDDWIDDARDYWEDSYQEIDNDWGWGSLHDQSRGKCDWGYMSVVNPLQTMRDSSRTGLEVNLIKSAKMTKSIKSKKLTAKPAKRKKPKQAWIVYGKSENLILPEQGEGRADGKLLSRNNETLSVVNPPPCFKESQPGPKVRIAHPAAVGILKPLIITKSATWKKCKKPKTNTVNKTKKKKPKKAKSIPVKWENQNQNQNVKRLISTHHLTNSVKTKLEHLKDNPKSTLMASALYIQTPGKAESSAEAVLIDIPDKLFNVNDEVKNESKILERLKIIFEQESKLLSDLELVDSKMSNLAKQRLGHVNQLNFLSHLKRQM